MDFGLDRWNTYELTAPAMLDRLMDLGLPVLVRRHAYNTAQCERAEQSGLGLAFEDWADVPEMAERLIGGSH